MNLRFIYTLTAAWRLRASLRRYIYDPKLQLSTIMQLIPEELLVRGASALALDYDGVLAAHGEPEPRPEVLDWLRRFISQFAPHNIYILSNKPTLERQQFFQQHFPAVKFIIAKRKKPYPDGLQQILADANLQPQQLLLVDDRLCTGILVTAIVGTQGLWVTKPYINFKFHPLIEAGIMALRWLEKKSCMYCKTS